MVKGIVLTVFVGFIAAFGYQNLTKVPLSTVIGGPVKVSLTLMLVVSFIAGLCLSVMAGVIIKKINKEEDFWEVKKCSRQLKQKER